MLTRHDIDVFKSTSFYSTFTIKNSSGVPINLSGHSVTGSIFDRAGHLKLADFSTTISNPASGIISFSIPSTILSGIPVTQGIHLIKVQNTGNDSFIRGLYGYTNVHPL